MKTSLSGEIEFLNDRIVDMAVESIKKQYASSNNPLLLFHNFSLCKRLDKTVCELSEQPENTKANVEVLRLAALFYPTGYLLQYEKALEESKKNANSFLKSRDYPTPMLKKVLELIDATQLDSPGSIEEEIIFDAIHMTHFGEDYKDVFQFLKAENEIHTEQPLSEEEWIQWQLHKAIHTQFYNDNLLDQQRILSKNIVWLRKNLAKVKAENKAKEDKEEPYKLEDGSTIRSVQTFFRSAFRVHINLSAIADNKANIMISVNAIVLSVIVSLVTYRNIPETNPFIMVPTVIFISSGLASLVFAVLSSRPRVTSLNEGANSLADFKENLTFFGNFSALTVIEFEELMDEMLKDEKYIFKNMVRDLYHLGKVLDLKYKYLTISYNIFMIGFVISFVAYLIVFLI